MNKKHIVLLLVTFGAILAIQLLFGIYTEDNETIVAAINYGEFGNLTLDQQITDYYFMLVPLLSFISRAVPGIPVYGLWVGFHLFTWLFFMGLYVYNKLQKKQALDWMGISIMLLTLVFLTLDSIVNQHLVRNGILLAFTALLFTADEIEEGEPRKLFPLLIFILALVVRMHHAVVVLGFFMAYHVLRGANILKVIKAHAWHLGFAMAFLAVYQVYGIYTQNMGKIIEANYEYAMLEKQSFYPLGNMTTAKDSAKYLAIQQFLVTDSAEMPKAFFERVVNIDYPGKQYFHQQNIANALANFKERFDYMSSAILLLLSLFAAVMFLARPGKREFIAIGVALVITLGVYAVLLLFLVDDLKIRFFSPLSALVIFLILTVIMPPYLSRASKLAKAFTLLVVLGFIAAKSIDFYKAGVERKAYEEKLVATAQSIRSFTVNKPMISFVLSEIPLPSGLFYRSSDLCFKNLAYFDGGYLTYYGYNKGRFIKLYGCSPVDYKCLVDMFNNRNDIRFYITGERIPVITNYFKTIYNTELILEPINPQPDFAGESKVYAVRVNKLPAHE